MSSRTLGVVALVLAALAAANVRIENDPLIATLFAGIVLLLMPGWLLLTLLAPNSTASIGERTGFAAAISWCAITALCVAAFKLEWPLSRALLLLFAGEAALALVLVVRRPVTRDRRIDTPQLLLCAVVAVVAILAYRTGGYTNPDLGPTIAPGWSTMEEGLQISTVRKIAEAEHLLPSQSMYARGEIPTYIYPVYPFALAAMSRTSGLDPLILFDTFRFWTAGLALIALYTLAAAAFGARVGAIAILAICAIILLGQAGPGAGFGSWGQLVPLTHIGDFSLGVLFPLALALVTQTVNTGMSGGLLTAVTVPFLTAMALTHMRESAQVVSYMLAGLVIGWMIRALDRPRALRLAVLCIVFVGLTVMLSRHIQLQVPFIAAHEAASAARAKIEMAAELRGGLRTSAVDVPAAVQPWIQYAFVVAPIALVALRFSAGAVILIAGLLAWWLPMNVPLAARLLERVVYSEIMMSPARYVFHASYLLFGLTVCGAALLIDRGLALLPAAHRRVVLDVDGRAFDLSPYLRYRFHLLVGGAIVTALTLMSLQMLVRMFVGVGQPAGVLAVIGAAFVAYRYRYFVDAPRVVRAHCESRFEHPGFITAVVAITMTLLFLVYPPSKFLHGASVRRAPQTGNLEQWYSYAQVGQVLPWTTVAMLRALPPRSIVAADPRLGLAIPMAADQFVLSSGTNFTTDLHYLETVQRVTGDTFDEAAIDWAPYHRRLGVSMTEAHRADILVWERYVHRQQRLTDVGDAFESRAPIFNRAEAPEITMRLLDALAPDYLLIDVDQHPHLVALVAARGGRFAPAARDGRFELYRFIEDTER